MSSELLQLTSTTAPGKVFTSRSDLADHYKSDWHKYNLKRREAGLPVLLEADFHARLEAAKALRQEKQAGKDHLKKNKKKARKKQEGGVTQVLQAAAYERIKEEQEQSRTESPTSEPAAATDASEKDEPVEIEPRQCLFDPHYSPSVEANVERMHRKYGFFLPDREYLTDLEGLVGYCHEKIKLGHMCLYCHKVFTTWQGCQKHMISKRHTKLRYEPGIDLEDLVVFYDFSEADADFLGQSKHSKKRESDDMEVDDENDEEDGWEDISDDEEEEEEEEDAEIPDEDDEDDMYEGYQEEVARMGFDVTPLGELVFPDGRIVGHRALRRYYKQRAPVHNDSTAVVAARNAAGERLYRGRVYNINANKNLSEENALALQHAGVSPSLAAGRAGKGVLVPSGPGGSFSQLSVYRYRAAVRKARRDDAKGQRLHNRTKQNINRMNKKHNRLMNGVSVAHAAR